MADTIHVATDTQVMNPFALVDPSIDTITSLKTNICAAEKSVNPSRIYADFFKSGSRLATFSLRSTNDNEWANAWSGLKFFSFGCTI